jgi:tetratricopeptide (TPR) repeat protein
VAEGVLGGVLGGGEEEHAAEEEREARSGAEAFAAALAADQAKHDPRVARAAETFLQWQARLLRAQFEELSEQRALRLRHLHNQSRESKLRRAGQRIRLALQALTGLVLCTIGAGVVVMLMDAFNSRSVIVEPFDAPPALGARGLTGKVIAGGLLDALTRLQAATQSNSEKRHLSNAWTGDIKVEVPETGVSVGDIDRMLKARFGHDLRIDGDLVQTDAGALALTVRGDGVLPKTFIGAAGELDKLTTQAAEYVYGQSEPSLYAGYLSSVGRDADAIAFIKGIYATAAKGERPYLLNTWANSIENTGGSPQEGAPLYREALNLKPDYWTAYNNLMNIDLLRGDEEGAWREGLALRKAAGGRPGKAPETDYVNWDLVTWNLQAWRTASIIDAEAHAGVGTGTAAQAPEIADVDVRLHEPADAELQLQTAQATASDPSVAAVSHFVHGRLAMEMGDAQRAAAEMEAFGIAFKDPVVSTNYIGYNCWIAPAEEMAGHPDKADAALKAGGHFVDCYRFEGDILDHRGDWAGAQRAYARSVAIAPDLPAGHYSWGVALARHGDLSGAIAKLQAANQRGPHWADPLKAWGDVLMRQDKRREALAKYDQALKYAPAWTELHRARDAAARKG